MPVGTLEHWKKRFQKKLFFLNGPALSPSPLAIKRRTFFPASLGKVLIKIQLFADISTNGGWGEEPTYPQLIFENISLEPQFSKLFFFLQNYRFYNIQNTYMCSRKSIFSDTVILDIHIKRIQIVYKRMILG